MELSNDILELKKLANIILVKVEESTTENAILRAENIALRVGNAELHCRLNQNSTNRSFLSSKIKPALSKSSEAKIGGQIVYKGKALEMSILPDFIIKLACSNVCTCGCDFSQIVPTLKERCQVYNLPQPKLENTEYQQFLRQCPSYHSEIVSTFPPAVSNHVQYGEGMLALCNLLTNGFHLSIQSVSQLFSDLYAQILNIINANKRVFDIFESTENLIKEYSLASPVVHFDASSIACEKETQWLHIAANSAWRYFFIHAKRGLKTLNCEYSLIKNFKNYAVHDYWISYFSFKNCSHVLCNAHNVRELQGLIENGSTSAFDMKALLIELYIVADDGKGIINDLIPCLFRFDTICRLADQEESPPVKTTGRGRIKSSKCRNLVNRLVVHKESIFAFAKYENILFTNNQAERDIRPVKTKISGYFRTQSVTTQYALIRGFTSTARKQGQSVFNELKKSYQGFNFVTTQFGVVN